MSHLRSQQSDSEHLKACRSDGEGSPAKVRGWTHNASLRYRAGWKEVITEGTGKA